MEAEGAELEVLQGSLGILSKVHYITVDCGPERGESRDYTLVEVSNFCFAQDSF